MQSQAFSHPGCCYTQEAEKEPIPSRIELSVSESKPAFLTILSCQLLGIVQPGGVLQKRWWEDTFQGPTREAVCQTGRRTQPVRALHINSAGASAGTPHGQQVSALSC